MPTATTPHEAQLPASETPLAHSVQEFAVARDAESPAQVVKTFEPINSEPADSAQEMLELARRHADQGRLEEASECGDRAISQNKTDAGAYYLLAAIRQEQGRLEEAANLLRKALYYQPKMAVIHYALGNLSLKQRNSRDAGKHLSNALKILAECRREDVVPQSGGLTAGRLRELVQSQMQNLKTPMPSQLEEA